MEMRHCQDLQQLADNPHTTRCSEELKQQQALELQHGLENGNQPTVNHGGAPLPKFKNFASVPKVQNPLGMDSFGNVLTDQEGMKPFRGDTTNKYEALKKMSPNDLNMMYGRPAANVENRSQKNEGAIGDIFQMTSCQWKSGDYLGSQNKLDELQGDLVQKYNTIKNDSSNLQAYNNSGSIKGYNFS